MKKGGKRSDERKEREVNKVDKWDSEEKIEVIKSKNINCGINNSVYSKIFSYNLPNGI